MAALSSRFCFQREIDVKNGSCQTVAFQIKKVSNQKVSTTTPQRISLKVELFFRTSSLDLDRWCCCCWPSMLLLLLCLFSSFSPRCRSAKQQDRNKLVDVAVFSNVATWCHARTWMNVNIREPESGKQKCLPRRWPCRTNDNTTLSLFEFNWG